MAVTYDQLNKFCHSVEGNRYRREIKRLYRTELCPDEDCQEDKDAACDLIAQELKILEYWGDPTPSYDEILEFCDLVQT